MTEKKLVEKIVELRSLIDDCSEDLKQMKMELEQTTKYSSISNTLNSTPNKKGVFSGKLVIRMIRVSPKLSSVLTVKNLPLTKL